MPGWPCTVKLLCLTFGPAGGEEADRFVKRTGPVAFWPPSAPHRRSIPFAAKMFWQPLRQAGLRAHEWKQRSRFCSLAGFRCIAFPGRSHASMTLRCDPVTGYSQWEVAVMHFYSFTVAGAAGALRRIDPPRTPFPFNPSAKPSGHLLLCCILTKHDARPVSIFPVGKRPGCTTQNQTWGE